MAYVLLKDGTICQVAGSKRDVEWTIAEAKERRHRVIYGRRRKSIPINAIVAIATYKASLPKGRGD